MRIHGARIALHEDPTGRGRGGGKKREVGREEGDGCGVRVSGEG